MIYYLKEDNDKKTERNAGSKARNDIENIFLDLKMKPLIISDNLSGRDNATAFKKIKCHFKVFLDFKTRVLSQLKDGDILFIQFPILNHSILLTSLFRKMVNRNIKIVLIIHDLDMFRINEYTSALGKKRIELEEERILYYASCVIAHNEKMIKKLSELGINEDKMINLNIFDYLLDYVPPSIIRSDDAVMIAGNLIRKKTGYVYSLPNDVKFYLFGSNYEGEKDTKNVHYFGSFPPEELPKEMVGKYGLVWDGKSSNTCEGIYGEYLRINNPHKTSLYLSLGIPVIIWQEAALSSFITENNCGITIKSLYELNSILNSISNDKYKELENGARFVSEKMRRGYYTTSAINEALNKLKNL